MTTPENDATVQDLLPLTPVAFEILLALGDGERHGYAVMREVEDRTGGRTSLHPGTLYRALGRLVEAGLLEERDRASTEGSERRRYYALTRLGKQAARAEAERLASQLEAARARRFLPTERSV